MMHQSASPLHGQQARLLTPVLIVVSWFLSSCPGSCNALLSLAPPQPNQNIFRQAYLTTTSRRTTTTPIERGNNRWIPLASTFAADGSEYSSKGDMGDDDDDDAAFDQRSEFDKSDDDENADAPTVELSPVPMSKNAGSRFVAFVWDRLLDQKQQAPQHEQHEPRDAWARHHDRIELTEDHVMYCRKANLYNETFNTDSMVDVLWSLPILASDLQRVVGHAMCMESTELRHVYDFMKEEPIIKQWTNNGDDKILYDIPLFRWRHIRDHSLRMDDGRLGFPCMCLGMDQDVETMTMQQSNLDDNDDENEQRTNQNLRQQLHHEQVEYLIRSEQVIASGPLHLPTEYKDDPSSLAVGDLILFNAKNRDAAIEFAENLPFAREGLYRDLRVHFYNTLDITGKFVSEDPLEDNPCADMKEAMEYWGYPVDDAQTPWLNR